MTCSISSTLHPSISRLSESRPKADESVVRLHARVVKMARFYARRSGEDADDLIQEAWLGLLEGLQEIDPSIGDPMQYLVCRARWRVLDSIKRSRVRNACNLGEVEGADLCASERARPPTEPPGVAVDVQDFTRALNPVQRDVLDCLLAGFTSREAGAGLGFSSANVCYHVREIRRRYEIWSAAAEGV